MIMPKPNIALSSGPLALAFGLNGISAFSLGKQSLLAPQQANFPQQGLFLSNAFPTQMDPGPALSSNMAQKAGVTTYSIERAAITEKYTYSLKGTLLTIEGQFANLLPTPFEYLSVALPSFLLGKVTQPGRLPTWNRFTLSQSLFNNFAPSVASPVPCAYALAENFGICFHCPSHFAVPTLFVGWVGSSVESSVYTPPSIANMVFHAGVTIAPGATETFTWVINVSQTPTLASTTSSFVADIQAFNKYNPLAPASNWDDRAILQFAAIDPTSETPTNPRGYNPGVALDSIAGITAYQKDISPQIGNAQGIIFWTPQGEQADLAEYAINFSPRYWPQNIQVSLGQLFSSLSALNFKVGLLARPSCLAEAATFNTGTALELDGDDANQVSFLLGEFDDAATAAVSLYYLDSFGGDLNSYKIMCNLRIHLGPNVLTFSEYWCAIMGDKTGLYVEWDPVAQDGSTRWYNAQTIQLFRLINPQLSILCKTVSNPAPTLAQYQLYKYTPLIYGDATCGEFVSLVQTLNQGLLSNRWP